MSDGEELKRQANAKLAEAWKLIEEAGELAKRGQFPLHFGEVGDYIPRSYVDRELLREQATENVKRDGRPNGHDKFVNDELTKLRGWTVYDYKERPPTPWDELTEDQRETAIEEEIDAIQESMEVPWEYREYGGGGGDEWWHPSRC